MAEKKVVNQAAIDRANATNAANKQKVAAATATAAAAKEAALPLFKTGITSLSKGTSALLATLQGKTPSAQVMAQSKADIAKSKEIFNTIQPLSTTYNQAQADIEQYSNIVSVPEAVYQEFLGTTGKAILKAKFQELQIPDEIVDSSISFIEALMDDGISQEDAVDIYYNNKDFQTKGGQTLSSPFYSTFTYLREYAPKTGKAPTPLELMQFKLGVKDLVSKYGRSSKFAEESAIQNFIKNSVRLTDLDQRFTEYKIAETKADPNQVATLVKLGFIKGAQDLGDFYADSTIGQEQFQINKNTAAFAAQALKRQDMGIEFNAERLKQLTAAAGYANAADTEAVTVAAARSFESLGENLMPGAKLSGIYEQGAKMTREEALANQKAIQAELENEIFMGTASQRRKRNIAQEVGSFQSSSGLLSRYGQTGSLGSSSVAGQI